MLRYGPSYHEARVSDLVLVGPNGELVEGEGMINIAAYIHHPILAARPDAVSAVHVHTGWGTPFSAEVRRFEPITQESCVFFEDHALFDDEEVQVQSVDAGKRIADALGATARSSCATTGCSRSATASPRRSAASCRWSAWPRRT